MVRAWETTPGIFFWRGAQPPKFENICCIFSEGSKDVMIQPLKAVFKQDISPHRVSAREITYL